MAERALEALQVRLELNHTAEVLTLELAELAEIFMEAKGHQAQTHPEMESKEPERTVN